MKSFESCCGLFLLCLIIGLHESYGFVVRTNNQHSACSNDISRRLSSSSVGVVNKVQQYSTSFVVPSSSSKSFRLFSSRGPPPRKAPKDDVVQVNGRVVESLPNAMFRVEIEPSKTVVLTTISGKIRKNSVRIVVGDSVVCELSAYDLTRGRITYRNK